MDRNKQIEAIRMYGNKNACYVPFLGGVAYPLYTQEFVRTGFMVIAPCLRSRDYKDPLCVIVKG
jgi:hypothetical protein